MTACMLFTTKIVSKLIKTSFPFLSYSLYFPFSSCPLSCADPFTPTLLSTPASLLPISASLYLLFHYSSFILLYSSSAQALCLSDEPRAVKEYRYPEKLPGELYDADTQCKWQFGEKAKLCTLDFKKVKLILTQSCKFRHDLKSHAMQ